MNNPFCTTVIRIASAFALADEVVGFLHAGSIDRKIATSLCILFFGTPIAVQAVPILAPPHNEAAVQAVVIGGDSCSVLTVGGSNPIGTGCQAGSASGPAEANSAATVGMGAMRISTSARANTINGATISASAVANATLEDFFAISGPPNSAGHLFSSIVISGNVFALVVGSPQSSTAAQSSYIVQTSVGTSRASGSGQYLAATSGPDVVSNITGGVLPLDVDIFFGPDGWAPITFSIHAQLSSGGTAGGFQQCSTCALIEGAFSTGAQFGSTIFWGGISLLTVNDVPLTDYQVISASGADYRHATDGLAPAVPEPASVWLFLFGLAAMGGYARIFRKSGDMQ